MADILAMFERLKRGARERGMERSYLIIPLHSSISTSQQQKAFERPPSGVRKIILSTKYPSFAPSSIPIDCR